MKPKQRGRVILDCVLLTFRMKSWATCRPACLGQRVQIFLPLVLLALGILSLCEEDALGAETYPQRPIRLVVPFTPGGVNDFMGRIAAQGLTDRLSQQVVVDNRSGAGCVLGTEIVANAVPNGYTILLASATHSINPGLIGKLPYDSINGFAPISLLAKAPTVLVAHPSLGVNTLQELVAAAKAKPGTIVFASSGTGSAGHMDMEMLMFLTKTQMLHVPYKGAGPAMMDLLAGRVQLMITSPVVVLSFIRSGKLRALGISSESRSPAAPEIATLAESGLPGYDSYAWYALLAPAGTPSSIVNMLNAESRVVMKSQATIQRLSEQGLYPVGSSSQEAASFIKNEITRWTKLIREANIRPD